MLCGKVKKRLNSYSEKPDCVTEVSLVWKKPIMFYRPGNTDGAWFLKVTVEKGHSTKLASASVSKVVMHTRSKVCCCFWRHIDVSTMLGRKSAMDGFVACRHCQVPSSRLKVFVGTTIPYMSMMYESIRQANTVLIQNFLLFKSALNVLSKEYLMIVFSSRNQVKYLTRFLGDTGLSGGSWVEVKDYTLVSPDERLSTCDMELVSSWKSLLSLSQDIVEAASLGDVDHSCANLKKKSDRKGAYLSF